MSNPSFVVHASRPRASPYYHGLIAGYAARGGPQMFTPWYPVGTEEYRLYSQGWDDGAGDWMWR